MWSISARCTSPIPIQLYNGEIWPLQNLRFFKPIPFPHKLHAGCAILRTFQPTVLCVHFHTLYHFPINLEPSHSSLSFTQPLLLCYFKVTLCTTWWKANCLYYLRRNFFNLNSPADPYPSNLQMMWSLEMSSTTIIIHNNAFLSMLQRFNPYQSVIFSASPWPSISYMLKVRQPNLSANNMQPHLPLGL